MNSTKPLYNVNHIFKPRIQKHLNIKIKAFKFPHFHAANEKKDKEKNTGKKGTFFNRIFFHSHSMVIEHRVLLSPSQICNMQLKNSYKYLIFHGKPPT